MLNTQDCSCCTTTTSIVTVGMVSATFLARIALKFKSLLETSSSRFISTKTLPTFVFPSRCSVRTASVTKPTPLAISQCSLQTCSQPTTRLRKSFSVDHSSPSFMVSLRTNTLSKSTTFLRAKLRTSTSIMTQCLTRTLVAKSCQSVKIPSLSTACLCSCQLLSTLRA